MLVTQKSYLNLKMAISKLSTKEYGDDFGVNLFSSTSDQMTPAKALTIETVYTCIRDKSETVGRLPVLLYDRKEEGKVERVHKDRFHRIFTEKPCDFMTMQGFLEFMVASYELYGAFYAYPAYNDRGSLMELIPFKNQQNIKPAMDLHGNIYYMYTTNDGQPRMVFGIEDLFVINQFTLDGFTPTTPIQYNANFLNGSYNTEQTWNNYQTQGITSQFALSTDKQVNEEAGNRLKKDWATFRGVSGVGNIPVLEDGMKLTSLQLSPKDAELLLSREFSVNRICRIFRVPPERIGVPKGASQSQTMLDIDEGYMRNSIEPILLKFENSANLLIKKLKSQNFVRINRKAFYSGSPHRMVEAVTAEFKMGAITLNEMRIDLGRDAVAGGDIHAVDTNNLTLGLLTDIPSMQEQLDSKQPNKPTPDEGVDEDA